jgi:hypothetical protein
VLPSDWAQRAAQRRFSLPDERQLLRRRYERMGPLDQFDQLLDAMDGAGAEIVYLEAPYVDTDFRAEYSHYFSRSYRPTSDKCERLLFIGNNQLLGVAVIRPIPALLGRTVHVPPADLARYVCCTAFQPARPWGRDLGVVGWPFLSQDGEYGRCAHAAVWSIARYHHLNYSIGRRSVAAVVDAAGAREVPDRTIPSAGLWMTEVVQAFRRLGIPALLYEPSELPKDETVESLVCRYLNSGFPVALNTPGHMTVLVGYGQRSDGSIFWIQSDDNTGPYNRLDDWDTDEWELLAIPMPGRFHVPGEAAETTARRAFRDYIGSQGGPADLIDLWNAGAIRLRTYAQEAADYKSQLDRIPSRAIGAHHRAQPASGWVWIVEFQDTTDEHRVIGEIVIDATSFRSQPQTLFGNVDGAALAWEPGLDLPYKNPVEPSGFRFASALPDRSEP